MEIYGLDAVDDPAVKVFHAGTAIDQNGQLIVSGGRVLCSTAIADTIAQAQTKAYQSFQRIRFEDMHYRNDIGYRALLRN